VKRFSLSRKSLIAGYLAGGLLVAPMDDPPRAADPQPYEVELTEPEDAGLAKALQDSSMLMSLRESSPVGPFALVARCREDRERFRIALESFGYYDGRIDLRIGGEELDAPGLIDRLNRAPADPPVEIRIQAVTGPLFKVGAIRIEGEVPEAARQAMRLTSGDPARADAILAARERLLQALLDAGHAFADVSEPDAVLNSSRQSVDLNFTVKPGPVLDIGAIGIHGNEHVREDYLRRRLRVRPGQTYQPAALEKAREDLMSMGVFSSVRVKAADETDAEGTLPVEFSVAEQPRHAVGVSAAYSTDVGGSVSTSWQHRNLFGEAEQLSLTAGVAQLGGNSTTGVGYNANIGFRKPDFFVSDQTLLTDLGAVKKNLYAYDQKAAMGSLLIRRKLSQAWSFSLGPSAEIEEITQYAQTRDYTLLGLPGTVNYDTSNSLLDPIEGIRAAASVTPYQPVAGHDTNPFVLMQLSGSTYLDLSDSGQSVLALRGLIGSAVGAGQFDIPADKRFYAGGSATVRGYKFLSIGPQFPNDRPQGGTAVVAGSMEFRQRFLEDYGAVAFVDIGEVTANGPPFGAPWSTGVGVGARYYTSIGPIRLDVALPLNRNPGSGSFELYLGLGQAF
jgi:translocation and assembly module TamA